VSLRQRGEPHRSGHAVVIGVGCDRAGCTAVHEATHGPKNGVQARREAEALGWMCGGFSGVDHCPRHPPTPADLGLTSREDT